MTTLRELLDEVPHGQTCNLPGGCASDCPRRRIESWAYGDEKQTQALRITVGPDEKQVPEEVETITIREPGLVERVFGDGDPNVVLLTEALARLREELDLVER